MAQSGMKKRSMDLESSSSATLTGSRQGQVDKDRGPSKAQTD